MLSVSASPPPLESQPCFTPRQFRDAMGKFATGVVVISTQNESGPHAMTANAFMSGSLEPPLVLVSVAQCARMHDRLQQANCFGVSILTQSQNTVSNHFAGRTTQGYDPEFETLHDVPVITRASVQIVATLKHRYPCGDHTLFVGEVCALRQRDDPQRPLVFHAGDYASLS